ncbi:MAG: hypothetical protein ACREH5_06555 [Candidatus Omnitrophota bacterium]
MKKTAAGFAALLTAVILAGFFIPIAGPWLDRPVSAYLSRQFHTGIRVEGSRVTRWSVLSFRSMALTAPDGGEWARSGPGRVRRSFSRVYVRLTRLVLAPKTAGGIAMISSVLPDGGKGLFDAREISVIVVRRKGTVTVHVPHWLSDKFVLRGGIKFAGGRTVKAYALLLFPRSFLKELPGEVRSRLKARPDGFGEFRLMFMENQLTLTGATGPFLKAQWQPQP